MTVLSSRILTLFVIGIFVVSSPLAILSDELEIDNSNSEVSGRVTVDYLVESISFGNASYPMENWTQPDKSITTFLIRGIQVDIDVA